MQNINNQYLMRVNEASQFLQISKSTFWKWVKEEKLPQSIKLSPRCTVWEVEKLRAFVESRKNDI